MCSWELLCLAIPWIQSLKTGLKRLLFLSALQILSKHQSTCRSLSSPGQKVCWGTLTFPLSSSRCRAGFREVRAWRQSLPFLKEEIFPAAVFANVPTLCCSQGDAGVVSLNFSHCPSCWKPLEHSKLEIHFVIYPNPSRDGSRVSQQLLGAALPGQTNRAGGVCHDPRVPGNVLPFWALFSALTVPGQMEVLLH